MALTLIAQGDVFRNPGRSSDAYPFVVVLQADAIHYTSTVMVAPLVSGAFVANSRLTPVFSLSDRPHRQGARHREDWALIVADRAPLPRSRLVDRVASIASERDRILAALDLLFCGF